MLRCGGDRREEYEALFRGKRLGLITAPTGLTADWVPTIDRLHDRFHLAALFSPEHGVRGDVEPGGAVETYTDPYGHVPVYSIYRRDSKRLTDGMLRDVDMVVYDIQDVGARFYTFISTLLYAMEDCARIGREFTVLDRPDPLGGEVVEGNSPDAGCRSFVGAYPLCNRYGLTAGEFARMADDRLRLGCRLHVVPCDGWERRTLFPETGGVWVPPSPNMPRFETALLYPGMCLTEGTTLSEGRGTAFPFEIVGAPYIDARALARAMEEKRLPGVRFRPVYFRPAASKYEGEFCAGVQVHVTAPSAVRAVDVGVELLMEVRRRYPRQFGFRPPARAGGRPFIDLLSGGDELRKAADAGELLARWHKQSARFERENRQYHLYS